MTGQETGSSTEARASGTTRPRVSRRVLAVVVLVVALSAAARLWDLGRFSEPVFDEYYYAYDAAVILRGDLAGSAAQPWQPSAVRSAAHPDLAKLAIAAGIAVLGDNAWGWRVPAALAGTALVALVFPLARRLGLSDEWALAALVLAASDSMLMIEARLGVLDTFVALGTVASVCLALRYVQSGFRLRWLVACGLALGVAVACKWSGLLAVPAVLLVLLPPLFREGRGKVRPVSVVTTLVLAPVFVYVAAAIPYLAAGHGASDWLRLQWHMATFGWDAKGTLTFASRPLTWPFDAVPIWYKWSLSERGVTGLFAVGNPLVLWGGLVAWIVVSVQAVTRRQWRLALVPALVAVLYLPWLLTTRQTYIYYMVPVIPFVAVVLADGVSRLAGATRVPVPGASYENGSVSAGHPVRRLVAWGFCLACVAVGVAYLPFVLGLPVPYEYYSLLTPFTTWK